MKIFKIIIVLLMTLPYTGICQISNNTFHKIEIKEVIQVSSYTYLRVAEGNDIKWLAVPKIQVKVGDIFYYKRGMEMADFKSTELDRTFKRIYFLSRLDKEPITHVNKSFHHSDSLFSSQKIKSMLLDKLSKPIKPVKGSISISKLLKNMESYKGKKVKIKGQVTKFNSKVMSKNWIHLQDGSEHNGVFDITFTTSSYVNIGDIITLEGIVSLDRNFGAGYIYKIIVENAVLVK